MKYPDITNEEWRWPHFTRAELACKASGECCMSPNFMDRLEVLRTKFGGPLLITSGYRSPEHNLEVSTTGTEGPHTQGRAVDVQIQGAAAYRLLGYAMSLGFTGIGVKQVGALRFLHLDDLDVASGFSTRPWVWSY